MILTRRFKLRPTRAQHARLDAVLELQRLLYNAALQERVEAWRKASKSVSRIDQQKSLTQIRSFDQAYRDMPVALSRWSLSRVDDAMTGFFGRVKRGEKPGFPRFKPISRWRSFGFMEWSGIRLADGKLHVKSVGGALKTRMDRPLPQGASIRSCTFTKTDGHWWVSLAVDVPAAAGHAAPDTQVGIDVGVLHLVTTSDGETFDNLRPRSRREKDLRRAARALARCRKGSKRRAKVRAHLARLQRRVAHARANHLHQVSASLTGRYALIAVEDLSLKNMTRSAKGTAEAPGTNVRQKAGLNRAMLDASPGRLIQLLTYKAERAGGKVVKVDPRGTSQDCSSCGTTVRKPLSERVHRCACGATLGRDVNAAKNILGRALSARGRGRPPGDANVGRMPVRRLGNAVSEAA